MRRAVAMRVVGPMQWVVYPAMAAIALTILLATPVELFGLKMPEPVLPLILAFAWPLIRPSMIAPAVVVTLEDTNDGPPASATVAAPYTDGDNGFVP